MALIFENLDGNESILLFYNNSLSSDDVDHMKLDRFLAVAFGVLGIILNLVFLAAIMKIRESFSANQQLVTSLLVSNLLVSVVIVFAASTNSRYLLYVDATDISQAICIYGVVKALLVMGQLTTLLNLVAMALDHYIAISKPLKHLLWMDKRHVNIQVAFIWILATVSGFLDFLLPFLSVYSFCKNGYEFVNYCDLVQCTNFEPEYILFAIVFVSFLVMTCLYTRVFITIYRYPRHRGRQTQNVRRNIKGLVTTIIILTSFMVCWLPYCVLEFYIIVQMTVSPEKITEQFLTLLNLTYYFYDLMLLNALFDPFIYAIRMPDVRYMFRRLFKGYLRRSRRTTKRCVSERKGTTTTELFPDGNPE